MKIKLKIIIHKLTTFICDLFCKQCIHYQLQSLEIKSIFKKLVRQNYQELFIISDSYSMQEWIKEIQFVKQMALQLLNPRKSMYQDDYLIYKLSKNTHLKHRHFKTQNEFSQILNATLVRNSEIQNQVCIIFLHGYGSNKQEGFTLIDYLPKQLDLCCFDFSASGKSQGKTTTYGLKQYKDIRTIMKQLKNQNFGYKKFILWGRSMGAVASFLMMCSQEQVDEELKKHVLYQVLDSPFSSFSSICYYQAKQSFKLPQAFISYGIEILKSCLKDNPQHLNPFNIDLVNVSSKCFTNSLFVYSETDDIIPQENTLSIIQNLPSYTNYQKLLISQNHNALRSQQTNLEIMKVLHKNYLKYLYNRKKNTILFPKKFDMFVSKSLISSCHIKREQLLESSPANLNASHPLKGEQKQTESTSGYVSRKQQTRKEKKYLQLLSSTENRARIQYTHMSQKKQIRDKNFYSNPMNNKSSRQIHHQPQKYQPIQQILDPANSSKQIHRLRRARTIDFNDVQKKIQMISNCQSLLKVAKIESIASPNKKSISIERSQELKCRKRALYCSLKKKQPSELISQRQINYKNDSFIRFNSTDLQNMQ